MSTPFIVIHPQCGRIGRICWTNSDLQRDPRIGTVATWQDGEMTLIPEGYWGSCYLCSPHPARPADAW
jgi:hypothetical protein